MVHGKQLEGNLVEDLCRAVDRATNKTQVVLALEDALEVISPRQYPELVKRIESALQYAKETKWAD